MNASKRSIRETAATWILGLGPAVILGWAFIPLELAPWAIGNLVIASALVWAYRTTPDSGPYKAMWGIAKRNDKHVDA